VLSAEDADAAAARYAEDRRVVTPVMMAGIGRRPAPQSLAHDRR